MTELYSDVDSKGKVTYKDAEEIFCSADLWVDSNEQYMYEWLWEILDKQGLTQYSNIDEYYFVFIYAMTLVYTYNNFCCRAFDEGTEFDAEHVDNLFGGIIPDVVAGQLYTKYISPQHLVEDVNEAVLCLIETFSYKVVLALNNKSNEITAFPIMRCANITFTEEDEETGLEDDVIMENLDDYKKYVTANLNDIYNDADIHWADVYGWLMDGGGAVDA